MVEIRREFGLFFVLNIDRRGGLWHVVVVFSVQVLNRTLLVDDSIVRRVDVRHGCYDWFGVKGTLPRSL
jgi:hypothetical protein